MMKPFEEAVSFDRLAMQPGSSLLRPQGTILARSASSRVDVVGRSEALTTGSVRAAWQEWLKERLLVACSLPLLLRR